VYEPVGLYRKGCLYVAMPEKSSQKQKQNTVEKNMIKGYLNPKELDSDHRVLHIFSTWTFSTIRQIMHLILAHRKQMGICFRSMQCIMAMYLGFSITLAIPISQSTPLFVMVICGYTILPYFPSNPSNPTRSYVSITKRRRESK
jgi:hypothetical protein